MNTPDKRFLAGVLGKGVWEGFSGQFPEPYKLWTYLGNRRWPWRPHAGNYTALVRNSPGASSCFALVASWGGDVTGIEITAGLDVRLPSMELDSVYGKADRLLGQLPAPETAPATKDTVQIHFAEHLPDGEASFGLAKVRGRLLWSDGTRHVLRIHRQMPIGWPGGDHHEADESALTGRSAAVGPDARLDFGLPWLTDDGVYLLAASIQRLDRVLAWMRTLAD